MILFPKAINNIAFSQKDFILYSIYSILTASDPIGLLSNTIIHNLKRLFFFSSA